MTKTSRIVKQLLKDKLSIEPVGEIQSVGRGTSGDVFSFSCESEGKCIDAVVKIGRIDPNIESLNSHEHISREMDKLKKYSETGFFTVLYAYYMPRAEEDDQTFLIVMKRYEPLNVYLSRSVPSDYEEIANKMCSDILDSLEVLEGEGRIHKDIKITNIFYDKDRDRFILGDLGSMSRDIRNTTHRRIGTLGYIAPDFDFNFENYISNDLYSLGVVLYKILSNNEDIPDPSHPDTEALSCSTHMKNVVLKAIQPSYRDRYWNVNEFRRALENNTVDDSDHTSGKTSADRNHNENTTDTLTEDRREIHVNIQYKDGNNVLKRKVRISGLNGKLYGVSFNSPEIFDMETEVTSVSLQNNTALVKNLSNRDWMVINSSGNEELVPKGESVYVNSNDVIRVVYGQLQFTVSTE